MTTQSISQRSPSSSPSFTAACTCLDRADLALAQARESTDHTIRYACAHVAALRAAAAVLAVRARPQRAHRQRNAWVLLTEVAPELTEWSDFFAAGSATRAAAEAGRRSAVSIREADDLVRDSDRFIHVVERLLGLSRHRPLDGWTARVR